VSSKGFFDGLLKDAAKSALNNYAEQLHAKAASIVDPETGKHSPVFVRRVGDSIKVETSGSTAFARELERRLGLETGEVQQLGRTKRMRLVYLAHATEDKAVARSIAEGLMARGVDVWFDEWEIGYGDSIRRKMDAGLGDCTHFVVLLTETSLKKKWVNEEIDAGLLAAVEGQAKFIGLRLGLEVNDLTPLLRNRLAPKIEPNEESIEALAAQILGISNKPPLGPEPRYVRTATASPWSAAALNIAEFFVRRSTTGRTLDTQATYEQLEEATGMPMQDVRLGALDLIGAGMLEKSKGEDRVWPLADHFSTFDGMFLDHDPAEDAKQLAQYLFNTGKGSFRSEQAAADLGWNPRRFNPAANWLVSARIVGGLNTLGGSFAPYQMDWGDELLRFVRSL
jgi:hypothetical protein